MQRSFLIGPGGQFSGRIRVPGDKSISHRSIMLGAIADGVTEVSGFLEGEDAISTMNVFRSLGVRIDGPERGRVTVYGVGRDGLRGVDTDLDCGNAGTAMRLLMGLLAGQKFSSKLVGDESLSRRPMKRVATPLEQMGAQIQTRHGAPPILIQASDGLKAINYRMPMASAQVKSAVLLAGLYADGVTSVSEPAPTRDHTERMLRGFGVAIQTDGATTRIAGGQRLRATRIDVPADISSAAFFLVGASIAAGSDLTIEHVGLNPTRTGILDILKLMGANISVENLRDVGGEPVGDLRVRSALLRGIEVPPELVPLAIDEFPVLFVAAACAQGQTVVTGAEELRVKESDRIAVMADGLQTLGIRAVATPDGMVIDGKGPQITVFQAGDVQSGGDHRIAMAFAMAATRSAGPILIRDTINVATSFPGFVELAGSAGLNIKEV